MSEMDVSQDQDISEISGGSQVAAGIDVALLIEIIQNYPYLYDLGDKRYKDLKLKARAWGEVAELVNATIDDCQKLWKSLRDKFNKEKKKEASGSQAPESQWEYFHKMIFFAKFSKPRRTFTNIIDKKVKTTSPAPDSRPSSSNSVWSSIEQILTDEDEAGPSGVCGKKNEGPQMVETPKTKKRKQESEDIAEVVQLAKQICNKIQEPRAPNSNESFCQYLLSRLNEMPTEEAAEKRKKILIIVENLE